MQHHLEVKDSPGRPRATNGRTDRAIVTTSRRHPFLTPKKLKGQMGLRMSLVNIKRRLRHGGLRGRVAAKGEMLTDNHCQQRLQLAQ